MRQLQGDLSAGAWRWLLIVGFVLIAGANLPGHLSTDSVIALAEGRAGERIVWGPPMFGALLGFFDGAVPGTGLYVAFSMLMLFGCWASMARLSPKVSWIAPVVLAFALITPQLMIYQAIVWKDVLFANFAVAGFVALAHAARRWETPAQTWLPLGLACLCLAMGCLVRQNGAIAVPLAALALGAVAWGDGWRRGLAWGAAAFAAPLLLAAVLDAATPVKEPPGVENMDKGMRLLQAYDITSAVAADPNRPLPLLQESDPAELAVLRREAPRVYSDLRIDTLGDSPALGGAMAQIGDDAFAAQWRQMILSDPLGYLGRRWAIFSTVAFTPDPGKCLAVHIGVSGPPQFIQQLNLVEGAGVEDRQLYNYATWWFGTPVFSHLAYGVLALAVAGFLVWRRRPADLAMAGLMLAGLGFAASFLIISLACDYRYMYFLDLAAITGALYVALDPSLRRMVSIRAR